MAGVVCARPVEARGRVTVTASEQAGIIHPNVPADGTAAFVALRGIFAAAYRNVENIRKQFPIDALAGQNTQ